MRVLCKDAPYLGCEILRCRHKIAEALQRIQIRMIEAREHLTFRESIQISKVRDHARLRIDRARESELHRVIMPVAIGIVAFAERRAILLGRKRVNMQPVRGGKVVSARQMWVRLAPSHAPSP